MPANSRGCWPDLRYTGEDVTGPLRQPGAAFGWRRCRRAGTVLAAIAASSAIATFAWSQIRSSGPPPPELYYLSSDQTIPVNGKGGSNIMGPYVRAKDWPQIPGGRAIDSGPAIHAESPDRIFVGTRGTRAANSVPAG